MPHVLGNSNDPRISKALPRALIAYAIAWVAALIIIILGVLAFQ